jgi:tRNA nucleotidyltransferase/poly(A) polymerase
VNAAAQLSMFEPEGAEALHLLERALAEVSKHRKGVELMQFIQLPGAARVAQRLQAEAEDRALTLAILLDLEAEAGL